MIKAIETVYKGYRFRSRLEARWAVFFDAAGIEYQYELEGYQLSDGTYYLPDFYLPWFKCYVEIKPEGLKQSKLKDGKDKLIRLFEALEDKITMLCIGDPLEKNMKLFCNDTNDSGGGLSSNGWSIRFLKSPVIWNDLLHEYIETTKYHISMVISAPEDRCFYTSDWSEYYILNENDVIDSRSDLEDAMLAAHQARFEYGE